MKNQRQYKIVEIITENEVSTQEQLCTLLRSSGFDVTQATVSRDIKELALIKQPMASGGSRYAVPSLSRSRLTDSGFEHSIILESVLNVDHGLNTVVLKCSAGMANAVCAKLDSVELHNSVGTLAGDDTVFVLMRTEKDAERLEKELRLLLEKR